MDTTTTTTTAPVFGLDGVSKWFGHRGGVVRGPATFVRAVEDVTLDVRGGEALGLVGESGSGKSTLGRLMLGFETPSAGKVRFEGRELGSLGRHELRAFRRRVQMVFQNTLSSLNPRRRIRDSLSAGMRVHRTVPRSDMRGRLADLLRRVGLDDSMLQRYPHQLSGGQRQRLVIARALSVEPEVLVADEAVSALDVSVQAQVLNLLKDLQREMNLTTIFIAHDLRVVSFFSDRIGVMYLGRLVEVGPRRSVVTASRHPYTRMLLSAAPGSTVGSGAIDEYVVRGEIGGRGTDEDELRTGCVFSPRCWMREQLGSPQRCTAEVPILRPVGGEQYSACHYADEVTSVYIRPHDSPNHERESADGV